MSKLQPGDKAPDFSLPATDGSTVSLDEQTSQAPATVVLFICNHCPYVKAYIPRLIAMQKQFGDKVRFLAICANDAQAYPDDSFENMKRVAAEWGLNFPYLHDADQSVAMAYGAERTPEVFALDQAGVCRYEGGIDDNYQDPDAVTQRPLEAALKELVAGETVSEPQTYAIGCTIKWKSA